MIINFSEENTNICCKFCLEHIFARSTPHTYIFDFTKSERRYMHISHHAVTSIM
ncbi:hypothetical protein Hanom_Chr09g00832741 [Helianthus anomalus]